MEQEKCSEIFSQELADRACNFIERYCTHVKGRLAGHPYILEDWEREYVVRPLFGTLKKNDRGDWVRKYRTLYLEVPRKNSKSTLSACLSLYLLFADGEAGAEIYCAAADKDQAKIVFDIACGMIRNNSYMASKCELLKTSVFVPETMSILKAITSKSNTKHGINASAVIIDELHAHQDKGELKETLETSGGSRVQPITLILTTAGVSKEGEIGYETAMLARKTKGARINGVVQDGELDNDSMLAVIYSAPKDCDPFDEEVWKLVNPNLGKSCTWEYFRDKVQRAKNEPKFLNVFKRLHLNIWTDTYDVFIPTEIFDGCMIAGEPSGQCVGGLDLSSTRDFTTLGLLFKSEDKFTFKLYCWLPEEYDRIKRPHVINMNISEWIRRGFIKTTPGNVIDYNIVENDIVELKKKYDITQIAYDPYNATDITQRLSKQHGIKMIEVMQGWKTMSPALKETEKMIHGGQLKFYNNPVLRWMNSNMVVWTDGINIKPDKKKSTDKIDGMVSLVMCVSRAVFGEDVYAKKSVYESRGIISL